jgi:hypothetical protein
VNICETSEISVKRNKESYTKTPSVRYIFIKPGATFLYFREVLLTHVAKKKEEI